MKRRPLDESDVPLLLRLYAAYVQWCIGALSESDRAELERMTPFLRQVYSHRGEWYDLVEAEWGLLPRGRAIIRQTFEEMSSEITAEEFAVEWTTTITRKIAQMSKRQRTGPSRKIGRKARKLPDRHQ